MSQRQAEPRQAFLLGLNDEIRLMEDPLAILARATELLGIRLAAGRVGYGEVDAGEHEIAVERDWTAGALPSARGHYALSTFGEPVLRIVKAGETLIVSDVARDPRLGASARSTYHAIGTHALVVVPLVKDGAFRAALFVHQAEPRSWSDDEVALVEEVAERTWSAVERARVEVALRQTAERLQLALQASGMGDWSWDAQTDRITLSDQAAHLFGLAQGGATDRVDVQELFHPEDALRAAEAMRAAVEARSLYSIEYRIRQPDTGKEVWIAAQGQPTYNPDGSLLGITGVVRDISERKRAQERQQLLIRELHHRVKNTLATVQAIVGSTARTASSIEEFYEGFVGRIVSLAQTHNLLTDDDWQKAPLADMLRNELGPYDDGDAGRVSLDGPVVELPSEAAVPVGMAIHELTTNAVKHGSLSLPGGRVIVTWEIRGGTDAPRLHFVWTERSGPPVRTPTRQGFGSRLLQRVLTAQLQADVSMDFEPEGIRFTMEMPIPKKSALIDLLS